MIEQKFKTGDIVQLKSGGPSMTVRDYEPIDSDEVVCVWFDGSTRHEKAFHQGMLNEYTDMSSVHFPIISVKPHNPNRF